MKQAQITLLKKETKSYGGELLKTRKGRSSGRPLDTKNTMHLVLRSSKARGKWSFKAQGNAKAIKQIIQKFSLKYGVKVLSLANVGNHLHFQIKLTNRHTYKPFIRAITAAIRMAVTGVGKGNPSKERFWDYRPFTRVVQGYRAFLTLRDYIHINQLEGQGARREEARFLVKLGDWGIASNSS
jgi:REP element-mobilizing transposase RayT